MANLTQTITNSQNLAGIAGGDRWGAYNWNAFKWLEGTADLGTNVTHEISESTTLDSSVGRESRVGIDESVTANADMAGESLSDRSGWKYVFPDNVTEAEDRSFVTWASAAAATASWASQAATSTVWS